MHGGIGMTDEYDIGLYMKRDRALQEFLGDQYYHTERVAQLFRLLNFVAPDLIRGPASFSQRASSARDRG